MPEVWMDLNFPPITSPKDQELLRQAGKRLAEHIDAELLKELIQMSTYYFLVCDDHKEICDAASRTAGGYCPLCDATDTLFPFIIAHYGCHIRIVSEHDDEVDSDEYLEWTASNARELHWKHQGGEYDITT